jgi:hypothetical protein
VSIQSLILVPEPYFNEPGYESRANNAASQQYNEVRGTACVLHMCEPPAHVQQCTMHTGRVLPQQCTSTAMHHSHGPLCR